VTGPAPPLRPPILATYRLQLHAGFPLARARELVPYLQRLGITHLHASPLLRARRGSQHGYDVVDPGILDPELGTEEDLEALVTALRGAGMGLVLDIVPNHMATSEENWRWDDVLAHGPASPYARWFDIEWRAAERDLHSRVLLPVLGDLRGRVVERGELRVTVVDGLLRLRYYDRSFPLDPASYPQVLQVALAACELELGSEHPGTRELRAIVTLLRRLPRRSVRGAKALARRRRQSGEALRRLRKVCALVPEVRRRLERAAARFGGGAAGVASLGRLLDAQAYRLVYWRRAAREINYRRFFDVNDLVALHMEDPEVFAQTHALVLDWTLSGYVDGFRIDHPDGLLDPLGYVERLGAHAFGPSAGSRPPIFVEKILSPGERLRAEWPVAGSTGYDFLNQAETVFLDPDGVARVARDYRRLVRRHGSFETVALDAKRRVLETALSAGVRHLARRLHRLSGSGASPTAPSLRDLAVAIVDTVVCLPVYRTYVDERHPVPVGQDRALLEGALGGARSRGRATPAALDVLAAALLGADSAMRAPEFEGLRRRFVQRFQQVSGPATAKGIEDTAFYSWVPLLSRNEVGGDPAAPVATAGPDLHAANAHRADCWPGTMLSVTTHDTKRSADVRARLDVLTELAVEWEEHVYRWRRWNRPHRTTVRGHRLPDANTEWMLYQTLVGAWPTELLPDGGPAAVDPAALGAWRSRVSAYMLKAVREAKTHTSWTEPDEEFEAALAAFIGAVLDPDASPAFLQDVLAFVARIERPGYWNALGRTVLQLVSPGVPDVYQGDELWNFSLVDPDNRRPVDFARRQVALADVEAVADGSGGGARLSDLIRDARDGRVKLLVMRQLLQARRERPELFLEGDYVPLEARGPLAELVVAFARSRENEAVIAIVSRHTATHAGLVDGAPLVGAPWAGTSLRLPWAGEWREALTGARIETDAEGAVELSGVLTSLPVAVLRKTHAGRIA
jgi:(1->4)-alpha-D-glucan 1-alpha-D-glucosylmutase